MRWRWLTGLIPMVYPDYQSVDHSKVRDGFEALWQTHLDDKRRLTVVEIMDAVHAGEINGMYIMGARNPRAAALYVPREDRELVTNVQCIADVDDKV